MTFRNCTAVICILLVGSIPMVYAAQRVYVPSTDADIYGTPQILQKCFVGFQDGDGGEVCYLLQVVKTSSTYSRLTQQKVLLHHGTLVDTLFDGTRHRIARNWHYPNTINLTCLSSLPGNGSTQLNQWSWLPNSGFQVYLAPFSESNAACVYANTDSLGHYEMYNNTLEGYKYIVFNNKSVSVRNGDTPSGTFVQVNQFAEHLPIETLNKNFSALTIFIPGWLYTDTFRLGTHGSWSDMTKGDSLTFVNSNSHSYISFPTPIADDGFDFVGWRSVSSGIIYQITDKAMSCHDEVFEAVFTNDTTPIPLPLPIPSDTMRYAEGTEFYFAFLKNSDDITNVTGEGEINCYIRVLARLQTHITLTAPDGSSQSYDIPANQYIEIEHLQRWQDNAYHLEASAPVMVEACNHKYQSQDVFPLTAVSQIGTSYVVQAIKSSVAQIAIIATEDDTHLTITKGSQTLQYVIRKGGLTLNRAEVCYLQSLDVDYSDMGKGTGYGSLSGTRVEANHPIVVIEGCAATPYQGYPLDKEYGASDHQCAQAYSDEWMGKEFILMGDESRGSNFAEFTTLTPNTQITTPSQVVTIQPGEVFQVAVNHRQMIYVHASQPVGCVLFLCGMLNHDGDPSQTRIYPIEHASDYSQFTCNRISQPRVLENSDIATLPMHVLHLACPTSQLSTMYLDGSPLVGWRPIPNLPNWSGWIDTIHTDSLVIHHLTNAKGVFTGYVSALSVTESYATHLPKMTYLQIADTLNDTICIGDTYLWKEHSYSQKGTYTIHRKNNYGIDSLFILNLELQSCFCDTAYTMLYEQIKEDELPYQWHGYEVTDVPANPHQDTALVYRTTKIDNSCDSITTLHLHILFPCELPTITLPYKAK